MWVSYDYLHPGQYLSPQFFSWLKQYRSVADLTISLSSATAGEATKLVSNSFVANFLNSFPDEITDILPSLLKKYIFPAW